MSSKMDGEWGRRIVESSRDCVMILDADARVIYVNPFGEQSLRISDLAAYLNHSWIDLWGNEHRAEARAALQAAFRGEEGRFVGFLPALDGTPKWWDVRLTALDPAGAAGPAVLSVSRDISDDKFAKDALCDSQERWVQLMTRLPIALYTCDMAGHLTFYNRKAAELWGTEPKIGDRSPEEIPNPSADEREIVITRPDESKVIAVIQVNPLFDGRERIVGTVNVLHDVTERRRIEEALHNSERIYRAIGESIDYGIWVCDAYGRNLYVSESFLNLVGMTQMECSEFGWGQALHPDDSAATIAAWKECVQAGQFWEREHRFRGVDGQWHYLLARGVPIRNDAGQIACWAGINLDMDSLKNAEIAIRESDRRKDQFLAMLAHELRNPLAPICNAIEILRRLGPPDPEVEWAREVIHRQVQHLTRLVDDLLDVSRITQGKVVLRKENVTLADVISDAIETNLPLVERRNLRLHVSTPNRKLCVEGDFTRLAQVISNLVHNAIKYTPEGGQISIDLEQNGKDAAVRVCDSGVGISAEMLPHIFDLFMQADHSLDRAEGGLGIGLTVARTLVEMHGGTVRALSAGIGHGTQFVVRLPLLVNAEAPVAPVVAPIDEPAPSRRVLVVEDHADSAESLRLLLSMAGHKVRLASDGIQAVREAQSFMPDVILMDIGLPGLSGYEAARQVRRISGLESVTLIALTGYSQKADHDRSRSAGFDLHLVKPIDPSVLGQIILTRSKAH